MSNQQDLLMEHQKGQKKKALAKGFHWIFMEFILNVNSVTV